MILIYNIIILYLIILYIVLSFYNIALLFYYTYIYIYIYAHNIMQSIINQHFSNAANNLLRIFS